MLPSAAPVHRLTLAAVLLVLLVPATARAQASGVLQATVRVLQTHQPGMQAALAHGAKLVSPADTLVVDHPSSRARVELVALPDAKANAPGLEGGRPRAIRATVTYLR